MPRWIGLLGSWALFVLGLGLASFAVAGEWINVRDMRLLDRLAVIDRMMDERSDERAGVLRQTSSQQSAAVTSLQSRVTDAARQTEEAPDTGQTIIVSTAENRLYLRRGGQTIFEAVCSTGKGTTLAVDGKTLVFDTPIGKFHIQSKDENPQWVPPDWHYVEQARKNGMHVVRLQPGQSLNADTGGAVSSQPGRGIWSWFGGSGGNPEPVLKLRGNTVVVERGGDERELPPGTMITAGNAIVIPPVDSPQRHFDKVLGHYRLELGDGYGIHGTDEPAKLGRAVSHGCVRVGDDDLAKLYQLVNVGDEVIIY